MEKTNNHEPNRIEMSEAAKEARRAYTKEYRAKHKDKIRQWNINYWEKRAKEMENK